MPALNPQPDDHLLDTILRLERELRESRSVRRGGLSGLVLSAGTQAITGGTDNKINFSTIAAYGFPVIATDVVNDTWTISSPGIYLASVNMLFTTTFTDPFQAKLAGTFTTEIQTCSGFYGADIFTTIFVVTGGSDTISFYINPTTNRSVTVTGEIVKLGERTFE